MNNMTTKKFDKHPFLAKIIKAAVIDAIAVVLGVVSILTVEPNGLAFGIIIIVIGSVITANMVFSAINNINCPDCNNKLVKESLSKWNCKTCNVTWELPEGQKQS